MALSKTISLTDNFGELVTFQNAYIKVDTVSGNKNHASANVSFYKEDTSTLLTSKDYVFNVDLDGGNFIAQAYEYLKTLDEFSGAGNV